MRTKILFTLLVLSASFASASPFQSVIHANAAGLGFTGPVSYSHTRSTATIHADRISNTRTTPSNALRLQLWATTTPPQIGRTISAIILAEYPIAPIGPGATAANLDSGTIPFAPPPADRYYVTLALQEFVPADNQYQYTDLFTFPGIQTFGAYVVLDSPPKGLIQAVGAGGARDSFVLRNTGDTQTFITLRNDGNFFTQFPSTFSLDPGGSQEVVITGLSTPEGEYEGFSLPSGEGVNLAIRVPVKLYSTGQPSGSVLPAALSNRIDISGTRDAILSGTATFTNSGTATLNGFLVADVPWIVPQAGLIRIAPSQTTMVSFNIDRQQRPDVGFINGSVTGTLYLLYVKGSANQKLLVTSAAVPPPTGLAGVVVSDTQQPSLTGGLIPMIPDGEIALMISGVGHVVGSGGKEFISDVSILNRVSGATPSDLKLYYSSNGPAVSSAPVLPPNQSLALTDVVTSYFSQQAQIGTMQIRSASASSFSVNASVFNKSNAKGTYGTAIPVFRSNRAAGSGEKLTLTGLRRDATSHTNVYLQEMSGVTGSAEVRFYSESGAQVGTPFITGNILGFGLGILGPIVPAGAVSAVVTNTSGARFSAYATPVDDASGDTWAVADWNAQAGISGAEPMLIPVAGAAPGANGTNFRTDVAITNIGAAASTVVLTYYAGSDAPNARSVSLNPGQTRTLEDVVPSFFLVMGRSVGAIIARPQSGRFAITSRTYTAASGDPATFGTGVPTLPLSQGLRLGESKQFGGIDDSTTKTVTSQRGATFRTNFALFETSGGPVTVRVTVSYSDGLQLTAGGASAARTFSIGPYQYVQFSGLLKTVIGDTRDTALGDLHNVQAKFEVIDGAGAVIPFITSTDNGTGDTVLRTE